MDDAMNPDTARAIAAAKLIVDGRTSTAEMPAIMVTLEHVVATILLMAMHKDHRLAAAFLNEALVPGIEARLALGESRSKGGV